METNGQTQNILLDLLPCGRLADYLILAGDLMILDPREAQREWLARWVFSKMGLRPKLDRLAVRDVALLYRAIEAVE